MEPMGTIAIVFLCVVGSLYSVCLLIDLCRKAGRRHNDEGVASSARQSKGCRRNSQEHWCLQLIAAAAFLVVAVGILVEVCQDAGPLHCLGHRNDVNLEPSVQVPGMLAVHPRRVARHNARPGKPIWGVDLALLPATDEDIHSLVDVGGEIEFLNLTRTDITDRAVDYFRQMPCLNDLSVRATRITDSGCAELAKMTWLESLQLSDTAVTDRGVACLEPLCNLRSLGLRNTAITDASVKSLVALRRLEWIDVTDTKITDRGIQELMANLPCLRQGEGLLHEG